MSKTKDTTRYSAENQRRWADPEYRARVGARISAGLKRRNEDPAARQALVDRWNAPGYRERVGRSMSDGQRRRYQRPEEREILSSKRRNVTLDVGERCEKCGRSMRTHSRSCVVCQAPLCRWAGRCCSKSCAGKLQAQDPLARERLRTLAVGRKRDHAIYSAGAAKRSAAPAYRERVRAAARKRSAQPGFLEKVSAGLKKWCADNPQKVVLRAAKIARSLRASGVLNAPRPAQSVAMRQRWRDPAAAQKYLDVIGTNHAPEYLDRTGRLWRFKSTWEDQFARALDAAELTWSYEPARLLLSDGRTYVPDFWVAEWSSYVEIKAGHRSLEKAERAVADGHAVRMVQGRAALDAVIVEVTP